MLRTQHLRETSANAHPKVLQNQGPQSRESNN